MTTEKRSFFGSDGCKLQLFCRICRDNSTYGKDWRAVQQSLHGDLASSDWECPKGLKFYDPKTDPDGGKVHFFTHHICVSRTNCATCRNTGAEGTQWRRHMAMTFTGLSSLNFECPYGQAMIPAAAQEPIPAQLPEASRSERLNTRIQVEKVFDTLVKKLPDDLPQKKQLAASMASGGCAGCKRNRLVGWLADEIVRATGHTKEVFDQALKESEKERLK